MSKEEEDELQKTLHYSNNKLFDTFNLAKSIWDIAFNNVEISVKKNKGSLISGMGYVFYYRKTENKVYVWEYQIKKRRKNTTNRTILNKIYENTPEDTTLSSIIETNSSFNKYDYYKTLPIFEMQCNQDFPMEQTVIPIMKRKITAYVYQIFTLARAKNFDSNV